MEFERHGDHVVLYLAPTDDDAERPIRRLYWFSAVPIAGGWRTTVPASTVESWLASAVPSDFEGGDKRAWRLATRFAQFRIRNEPAGLGVHAPSLPHLTWERV